jgi:hypothetical protein
MQIKRYSLKPEMRYPLKEGVNIKRIFFGEKQSIINYCKQKIVMGDVVIKSDPKPAKTKN